MILDVLQHKKIRINNGDWFIPSNTYTWTANSTDITEFTFEFIEPILLDDINFSYTANQSPYINLYYSYDGNIYNKFEYITYNIVNRNLLIDNTDVIERYVNRLIKINYLNFNSNTHIVIIVYKDNGVDIDDLNLTDYDILKSFIAQQLELPNIIDFTLKFKYINGYNNEVIKLYNNPIKCIKLKFELLTLPFVLNKLEIFGEEFIESFDQSLSLIYESFFTAKYFQEYTFIPSITKTFFEMLEEPAISQQQ